MDGVWRRSKSALGFLRNALLRHRDIKSRHGMREGQLESKEGLVGFKGVFEHRLIWRER